ncbi:MAG: hypothetical protein OHK0023_06870 [Anaerolineae bacterium]
MIHENVPNQLPHVLELGRLTPDFNLRDTLSGTQFTREQFRGKQGLVLLFLADPHLASAFLDGIRRDASEYRELNAQVLAICERPHPEAYGFPILEDRNGQTWRQYTHAPTYGYAVFILDNYGGLDKQYITVQPELLPDPADVREWCRGAQYRCNI